MNTNRISELNEFGLPRFTADGEELHWVRTSVLRVLANPFNGCWRDLEKPLTFEDVTNASRHVTVEEPHAVPFNESILRPAYAAARAGRRQMRARKVAWFVRYGFQQPLSIDVGVPSLGCHVGYIVQDGNHRLAAAIYRAYVWDEDPLLPLVVSGSVDYAKELGLWVGH